MILGLMNKYTVKVTIGRTSIYIFNILNFKYIERFPLETIKKLKIKLYGGLI